MEGGSDKGELECRDKGSVNKDNVGAAEGGGVRVVS